MLIMSCYTGFFNVRRGWQSLNTGPMFYLRLIRRTGWLWIYTSRTTDGRPFKPKKLSVPFLYPGVPAGLTPFRGLVPLGRSDRMVVGLCNLCLSPLKMWLRTPDHGEVYLIQRYVVFSGYCGFSTNKNDRHDIIEILLKVALNTIDQTKPIEVFFITIGLYSYMHKCSLTIFSCYIYILAFFWHCFSCLFFFSVSSKYFWNVMRMRWKNVQIILGRTILYCLIRCQLKLFCWAAVHTFQVYSYTQ
jgi:hypothetical protein